VLAVGGVVGFEAVGTIELGVVCADGGAAIALLPAPPVVGLGAFTMAGPPPGLSPPPHAERIAATPKHVAIRDLMSASNIGTLSKKCELSGTT
jgi:hypothetical protein